MGTIAVGSPNMLGSMEHGELNRASAVDVCLDLVRHRFARI
jgi:hypothetical protein